MNIGEALEASVAGGLDRRESRVLLAEASGLSEALVLAYPEKELEAQACARFESWVSRRRAGEPLAYLIGWREFFSLKLTVTPAVLVPRSETELLVELALERLPRTSGVCAVDLGTGSGAVAIALKATRPAARVAGVDLSQEALEVARGNAKRLGLDVDFRYGSWFEPIAGERYDLIVANPPYVALGDPHLARGDLPKEPRLALVAGHDGLIALRAIARGAPQHLRQGGWLLLEHGHDQAESVRGLLAGLPFEDIVTWPDLAGIARVTGGRYNPDKFTRV